MRDPTAIGRWKLVAPIDAEAPGVCRREHGWTGTYRSVVERMAAHERSLSERGESPRLCRCKAEEVTP